MNKVTAFNYVLCSVYLKCFNCKTVYRLKTSCEVSHLKNKHFPKFYSTNGLLSDIVSGISEHESNSSPEKGIVKKGKPKRKTTENKKKVTKVSDTIVQYINSLKLIDNVKKLIISALEEKEEGIYLTDEGIAKHLSDLFVSELKGNDSLVIEANPGLGFLTRQLLQAGIPYIRLFESSTCFYEYLKKEKFLGDVDLNKKDIVRFWKMQYIDRKDGAGRMARIFEGVSRRDWEDDPAVKVVAAIPDKKFIWTIIDNIITRSGFVKYGRPQFFLVLDPLTYYGLTNPGNQDLKLYRPDTVLFQVLFDCQILSKVPKKVFVPSAKVKKFLTEKQNEILEKDGDLMYVIKLTPHKDLFSNNFDKKLPLFQHFVKQMLSSRSKRVIPQLEMWAPGCGPDFIALGYDIYTESGELTPKELLDIFLKFLSFDDSVENSSLFASMDAYLLKKYNPEDIHDED